MIFGPLRPQRLSVLASKRKLASISKNAILQPKMDWYTFEKLSTETHKYIA